MEGMQELGHVIASLSARLSALEGAIHALARTGTFERERTVAVFDAFGQELLERYQGLPVDDGVIELVEESLRDVRALLGASGFE